MEPARIDYFNNGDILRIKNLDECYPTITKDDIIYLYGTLSEAISIFYLSVCASFVRNEETLARGVSEADFAAVVVKSVRNAEDHRQGIEDFTEKLDKFFKHVQTAGGSVQALKDDVDDIKNYAQTYVKGQMAVLGVLYNGPCVPGE